MEPYLYTWRYRHRIEDEAWPVICRDTAALLEAVPYATRHSAGSVRPALINNQMIQFNGHPGMWSAEDFRFRPFSQAACRCKTSRHAYDQLVCCVLAMGCETGAVVLTRDGNHDDWTPYMEWASSIVKRTIPIPRVAE